MRSHGSHGEGLCEAAPLDELEREVREVVLLTNLVDRDDVGMLHAGDGLGFGAKARALAPPGMRPGQNDLERDIAAKAQLLGAIDDSHSTPAQLTQDLKAGDLLEDRRWLDPVPLWCTRVRSTVRPARRSSAETVLAGAHPAKSARSGESGGIQDSPGHCSRAAIRNRISFAGFAGLDLPSMSPGTGKMQ